MSNEPTQLNTDLAAVCGFAVGNRTKASVAINQAKTALGIDKHTKSLSEDDKTAIVQWHKARLNDDLQVAVETIAAPVIENSHALSELETLRLKNAELQARLELIDSKAAPTYPLNEIVRLGFYSGKKRTVIALSGFYLNALMIATGLDKKAIPAWISTSVSGFEGFNAALNVTEQVKLLIVRELESELIKGRVV